MATVTMYRDNKLDQAEQHDPAKLAEEFVATLKGGINENYETSGRLNVEFEYRWFLAGFGGEDINGFTWDDEDWTKLWHSLLEYMNSDVAISDAVIQGLG